MQDSLTGKHFSLRFLERVGNEAITGGWEVKSVLGKVWSAGDLTQFECVVPGLACHKPGSEKIMAGDFLN